MIFIYNLAIRFYVFAIRLSAFFGNPKAKLWIRGRANWRKVIGNALKPDEKRIWFHCSSLGEFEQGRPVMEQLKKKHPSLKIVLTFFSPSGYEIRKNYEGADYVFYLPADTRNNASDFISLISPQKVFFTKYEYWHHYFHQLKNAGISLYMISAIFRPGDRFFQWYGGFFRNMLHCVTHFFVQEETSRILLRDAGFENATVAGDTRFDRVVELAAKTNEIPAVQRFADGKKVLVAGSTWSADEKILAESLEQLGGGLKLVLAPHEISEVRMEDVLKTFAAFKVIRFSSIGDADIKNYDVLVADNMGMLSSLYRYGSCAYVGGGFGKGIHNTLEAAVYGIQVFFGPQFKKFNEAKELLKCGGARTISGPDEFTSCLRKVIDDEADNHQRGSAAKQYVQSHAGATDIILNMLFK